MTRTDDICKRIFQYPQNAHVRRHSPLGYVNYQSCKPWLRDEFQFRCVYCLWRENWVSIGEEAFSVEHLTPRAAAPDRVCDYENLTYACSRCNSVKTDASCVLDPCRQAYGEHVEVLADGTIHGLTVEGRELIVVCKLDRPRICHARRQLLELLRTLQESTNAQAATLLQHYLGFPDNLPVLSQHRPPGGNARPDGISDSYYERRQRGVSPLMY